MYVCMYVLSCCQIANITQPIYHPLLFSVRLEASKRIKRYECYQYLATTIGHRAHDLL